MRNTFRSAYDQQTQICHPKIKRPCLCDFPKRGTFKFHPKESTSCQGILHPCAILSDLHTTNKHKFVIQKLKDRVYVVSQNGEHLNFIQKRVRLAKEYYIHAQYFPICIRPTNTNLSSKN